MGRPRLKWGAVEKYLVERGFEIRSAGGEKVVVPPKDGRYGHKLVRIGHTSCNSPRAEILKCYESKLRNVFGIDLDQIG